MADPFAADAAPIPILMRLPEVMRTLGVGRTTVYKLLHEDPDFPRPVRLGERAVAWKRTELEAWAAGLPRAQFDMPSPHDPAAAPAR